MYVFGNGESRTSVDINKLDGVKVGCNAIHLDYNVDHLICVDRRMVNEAVDALVNDYSYVYTREDWVKDYHRYKRIRTVPTLPYQGSNRWDEPFQWGSGPYAILLAAKLSEHVKLIGFDLYSKDKTVNNIYKNTVGYDPSTKNAVDPRYWIHQIGKIFEIYPRRTFTIYQTENWQLPPAWKYPNVSLDNLNNL